MKKIVMFLIGLCILTIGADNVFAKNVKTIEYKTESIKYFDTAKRQVFYTDDTYKYYFKANIGDYINVIYDDDTSEIIIKAFEVGNVTLNDLTTHGIEFSKIEKDLPINPHTDVGGDFVRKLYKDDTYVYFESFGGYVPIDILRDDLNKKKLSFGDLDIIGYEYGKVPIKDIEIMEFYADYLESTDTYKNLPKDYDKSINYANSSEQLFYIGLNDFSFKDDYILYESSDFGENLELHQEIGNLLMIEIIEKLIKDNNYSEEDLMFYDYEATTSYEKNGIEYKIDEKTGLIKKFKINLNKITLPIDEDAKVFSKFTEILEGNLLDFLLSLGCSEDYCVTYGYEKDVDSRLYAGHFELQYKDGKIHMISSFVDDEEGSLEFHEDLLNKVHEAMIKAYIEYHGLNNDLLNNYKSSELSKLTLKDNGIEYKKNVSGDDVEYSFKMNVLGKISISKVTYNCEKVEGKYYDSKGNEVDKKTYENVCGIDENPHTGEAISILSFLGLGCLGLYIKKHSKKKIKYNI